MPAPIVFIDIVGPELPKQAQFYREVFGWEIGPGGTFSVPATTPMQGVLRVEDPKENPTAERVIYLGVPDINATLAVELRLLGQLRPDDVDEHDGRGHLGVSSCRGGEGSSGMERQGQGGQGGQADDRS